MSDVLNKIINEDVLVGLKQIPDETVSLVFNSPPYNTDIKYNSHDDNMPWDEYLAWIKEVWTECNRVLRPGGRLVINIDATTNWDEDRDKEYIRPIYARLVEQMDDIGLNFRGEILWLKHQVVGRQTAWGSYMSCSNPVIRRNHEYLLIWSKDSWKLEGDSEMSDMTDKEFQDWTMSSWEIVPETRSYGRHPAPFPEELARRVIKLFSYRGDVVLDPFSGSGTTCKVAVDNWRKYIGIELDKDYAESSRKRISKAFSDRAISENEEGEDSTYVPRSERIKNKTVSPTQRKKNPPPGPDIFNG